jgi:hypothetical protein
MLQKEEKDDADSLNFLDMNIWKIKEEFLTDDIMNNIKKNTNNIRILTEVLSDEEKHDKKKKIKNYQSFDGLGKRGKNKDSKISKNVKKIMSDVGKLVLDMKTISENSYKENIKSLRKTTNEIKKTEIIPEKNIILKIKEKEYKAALEGKLKKAPNFQILSDCYRKQINKAFVNYNPNIHISNIHKLSQTEQETQKEYESRLSEIDKFIYDLKSKENKGFRKPFSMDKKIKKNKTNEEKNNTSGINNSSVGYTVATAESENNSQILPTQIINIYGKKKPKVEVKRKFPEKEKREKELNLMNNVLKNIDNSISKENIGNYFDRYKEIPGTEIDQQRHIFFNGLGKANKLLTEIQEVLHYKDADDNANVKRKQTTYESDNLIDKLESMKKLTINEIDVYEKNENKIYERKISG